MTYNFSEEAIRLREKKNAVFISGISISIITLPIIRILLNHGVFAQRNYMGVVILFFILVALLFYGFNTVITYLRSCQLELDSTGIQLIAWNKKEKILFSDIKKMTIYEDPTKILLRTSKNLYVIYGFESMEEILEAIRASVDSSIVRNKTRMFNTNKTGPLLLAGLAFVLLLNGLEIMLYYFRLWTLFLMPILAIGEGIYFVFYAPVNMRKQSPKITGWALLGLGLFITFNGFRSFPAVARSTGLDYEYGRHGKTVDYTEGMKWLLIADRFGDAAAESAIGYAYTMGYGVPKDYSQALKWLESSASKNDASGQNNLGWLYQNGWGVPQDYSKALELYQKAVQKNNAGAEEGMGELYENGWGVEKDYSKAMNWYKQSADQGVDVAMYRLGLLYKNGNSVAPNPDEAKVWFEKAANLNNLDAKKELGK